MSSSDKTRQKLMETMRMTKAGSSKTIEDGDTKQPKTSPDDKPIMKKMNSTAPKKEEKKSQKSVDPYQTVRRVWPD